MKSSHVPTTMPIGELAANFGLASHVLRHWESIGLLHPARTPAGHRQYGQTDQYRVAAILQAKRAGLGLDDIHAMLTAHNPAERRGVLQAQRDQLIRSLEQTQTALTLIESALHCRHGDLATCPRFQELLTEQAPHPS